MSEIYEAYRSPDVTELDKGSGGKATIGYVVIETAAAETAKGLVRGFAPLAIASGDETLIRQSISVTPTGLDSWEGKVDYGPEDEKESQKKPEPGFWKFAFDTTGGRHTRTVSRKTLARFWNATYGVAPDLKGAINWDGKTAKGVEVLVPNGKFHITAYYEASEVTPAFFRRLKAKTTQMNSDPWLGYPPGEVQFLGSQGQGDIKTRIGQRVQPIAVNHYFDTSENLQTPLTEMIAAACTNTNNGDITIRGFDYLWYRCERLKDNDTGHVVGRPVHAYVEELYASFAFGEFFGFGGTAS